MEMFCGKLYRDSNKLLEFIQKSPLRDNIIKMYAKGPSSDRGFMWTPDEHWTDDERLGLKCIDKEILRLEWDSSGYGIMHRRLQKLVNIYWQDTIEFNLY